VGSRAANEGKNLAPVEIEEHLVTDSPLTRSLAALSRFFVGDGPLDETLRRVVDLTRDAVPPADMVAITLPLEDRRRTAIYTDELAPEIDQAQYDAGDGPCVDAFEEMRITAIEDTRADGKWPEFRQAAAKHGIHSTMSFPLIVNKRTIGALNLYSRVERAFSEGDAQIGMQFASHAAIVLANAQAYWDARELSAHLGEAMTSRAVIEQAKGIIMGAQGCNADRAFDVLVRASQRENIKLRVLAQRIVDQAASRSAGT
jgi:GAF domain-containing protein